VSEILSASRRLRRLFHGAFSVVRGTPLLTTLPASTDGPVKPGPNPSTVPPSKPTETAFLTKDTDGTEAPVSNHFLVEALAHIQVCQWGRAQRSLYQAERDDPSGEAHQYLDEVRAIRRCLRHLEQYPRDVQFHLQLGVLFFQLELGDEALRAWGRAVELDPDLAEGHFYLALEYYFRGDLDKARQHCEQASLLNPALPTFEELQKRIETEQSHIDLLAEQRAS
jgi:tetratricopeptide (TPR) repeat protein